MDGDKVIKEMIASTGKEGHRNASLALSDPEPRHLVFQREISTGGLSTGFHLGTGGFTYSIRVAMDKDGM